MELDMRPLKTGFLTALMFAAMPTVGVEKLAGEPNGFFEYEKTDPCHAVAAGTINSMEKRSPICGARDGSVVHDHLQSAGSCRILPSVSGAQDETGIFAATRRQALNYREPGYGRSESDSLLRSEWNYSGNTMVVEPSPARDGSTSVEILYQRPVAKPVVFGIRPGPLLFNGVLLNGTLSGRARFLNRECGMIEHEVEGPLDPFSKVHYFLGGAAPKRGIDWYVQHWV